MEVESNLSVLNNNVFNTLRFSKLLSFQENI